MIVAEWQECPDCEGSGHCPCNGELPPCDGRCRECDGSGLTPPASAYVGQP